MAAAPRIAIRSFWQFALFGVVGFVFVSFFLTIARACGFIDFYLEKLPAQLFASPLHQGSDWAMWLSFYVLGALLGLGYHAVLTSLGRRLGRVDWILGSIVGLAQWFFLGLVISLSLPDFTRKITFLPTEGLVQSIPGFLIGLFLLVLNVFFGGLMGSLARRPEEYPEAQSKETAPPKLAMAEQPRKAA